MKIKDMKVGDVSFIKIRKVFDEKVNMGGCFCYDISGDVEIYNNAEHYLPPMHRFPRVGDIYATYTGGGLAGGDKQFAHVIKSDSEYTTYHFTDTTRTICNSTPNFLRTFHLHMEREL